MEATEKKVLETMLKIGVPTNAGKIAEQSEMDKNEVIKAMKVLRETGRIVSPKRCFWQPIK
ncbi:MarR family transcriptional regulator [Chryseobacterium sp. POL2]|uniref:MarR family transcriptional regulator n=1 Tax=Chryseobacterium TaxID=59732 RepID=UPI0013E1F697|nr:MULTISPECIES: MarR family transcriptional regulator [Chryseobacterium]MDM1554219.1 MarR family transcriptional regulator [Chryseobacterium indologenes]QIG89699.1 MarR family transcriptional regulator [Chryseobacterium sp. POL2]